MSAELSATHNMNVRGSAGGIAELIQWDHEDSRWHLLRDAKWKVQMDTLQRSLFIFVRRSGVKPRQWHPVWEISIVEKTCFDIDQDSEMSIMALPHHVLRHLQDEYGDLVTESLATWRSTHASGGKRPRSTNDDDDALYEDDEDNDPDYDPNQPDFPISEAHIPAQPAKEAQPIEPAEQEVKWQGTIHPSVGGKAPRKIPRPQTGGKQPKIQPSRESDITSLAEILESVNDCSTDSLDPVDQYIDKLNKLVYNRRSASDSNFDGDLESAMTVTTHLDKMISSLTALRQRVSVFSFKAFQKIGKQKGKRKQQLADIIDFVDTNNNKKKKSPNN
jgi:hypothetical protein